MNNSVCVRACARGYGQKSCLSRPYDVKLLWVFIRLMAFLSILPVKQKKLILILSYIYSYIFKLS